MKRPWKTAGKTPVKDVAAATPKVKETPGGRRRGETWVDAAGVRHVISPDDDLGDLESPTPPGWLGRPKRDWLSRRQR